MSLAPIALRYIHTPDRLELWLPRVSGSASPSGYFESLERAGIDEQAFEAAWPQDQLRVTCIGTSVDPLSPPTLDLPVRVSALVQLWHGERPLVEFESGVNLKVTAPGLTVSVQAISVHHRVREHAGELLIVAAATAGQMWARWVAEGVLPAPGVTIDTVSHAQSAPAGPSLLLEGLQSVLWDAYIEHALDRQDCDDAREALTFEPEGGVSALSGLDRARAVWLRDLWIRGPNPKTAHRAVAQHAPKVLQAVAAARQLN